MPSISGVEIGLLFLALVALAIWLWALIDCALHEPATIDKLVWVIIILWLNVIGAVVYVVFRRPRRLATAGSQPAA